MATSLGEQKLISKHLHCSIAIDDCYIGDGSLLNGVGETQKHYPFQVLLYSLHSVSEDMDIRQNG